MELHSKCQTISVDRGRIAVINAGKGSSGSVSTYSRTPMHGPSGTPLYNTPGSRTPMYGSQTPLYDGTVIFACSINIIAKCVQALEHHIMAP